MKNGFETAAVIGTGQMGPGIALTLAAGGTRTILCGRTAESARNGLEKARFQLRLLSDGGLLSQGRAVRAAELLSSSSDLERSVKQAELVIESAPENMSFKQELFARLESLTAPTAVLASNTSGLSITDIQSRCHQPQRVITTHFWNPPYLMPLVEIVRGRQTAPELGERLREYFTACGKVAVIVAKDRPGQLGNRLQSALIREALYIVQEGIATVEDVDRAVKNGFGMRLPVYGVFEHLDAVGFEIAAAVADYVSRDLCNHQGVLPVLEEHRAANAPFCDWSTKNLDEVRRRRDEFLIRFLSKERH